MDILLACEESQAVTIELRKRGLNAFSCDLKESTGGYPQYHIKGDAITALYSRKWDLVIAHPPCTRLSNSGVRWLEERNYWYELEQAADFFNCFRLYGEAGNRLAIENPIPHKYAVKKVGKYSQIIHPWQFGHMEQKATCLWLYGLPKLKPTNIVYKEMMKLEYKERAKIHYASPGENRAELRSKTYPGIAAAIADQWTKPFYGQIQLPFYYNLNKAA